MRELAHRSKNQLAVIQGMATQTARQSNSVDEFVRQFTHASKAWRNRKILCCAKTGREHGSEIWCALTWIYSEWVRGSRPRVPPCSSMPMLFRTSVSPYTNSRPMRPNMAPCPRLWDSSSCAGAAPAPIIASTLNGLRKRTSGEVTAAPRIRLSRHDGPCCAGPAWHSET